MTYVTDFSDRSLPRSDTVTQTVVARVIWAETDLEMSVPHPICTVEVSWELA